jgi:rod shape-determining protein MreD
VRLIALFAAAALIFLGIQTILPYWFPIGPYVPHLVLILSVDLGLRHPGGVAAGMAFAMGYATDAVAGSQIGLNAFSVTLVFLIAYEISRHLMATSDMVGAITVFAGTLINSFGALALASNSVSFSNVGRFAAQRMVIQALITAALAPPVFALLRRAKVWVGLPIRNPRE